MPRASKAAITNNNDYVNSGVSLSPAVPSVGDKVKLSYDGLLAKSGASDILAHVGYGCNWESTYDYRMQRTSTGFETTIPISNTDTLNVCFKDCANNWDNNTGKNYSFDISQ